MKLRIWIALIAVYIAWGSTYLAIRFAVLELPPFFIAATRFLVAGGLLYVWQRLAGLPAPTRRQWKTAAVVGLFLLVGGNGLVTLSEQRVVSGVAALLVGGTPLWMVLIDTFRKGGRRPGLWTWVGVALGFAGIVLLISPGELAGVGQAVDPSGALGLLAASMLWATGSIYSREHHTDLPEAPLLTTGMEMLAGGAALLVLSLGAGEFSRLHLEAVDARAWWSVVYLIVGGSLIGYTAYSWLIRVAPTPLVATYAYVNPLVAVFMGWLLAGEPLTLRVALAAVIIVGAVVVINLRR